MAVTGLQLITITGKFLKLDGTPAAGNVSFTPSTVIINTVANEIVYPVPFSVTLDGTGSFSIVLPATNDPDLSPTGWAYAVKETITGSAVSREYNITIPHDAAGQTLDLADIVPVETIGVLSPYSLVGHTHSGGGGSDFTVVDGPLGTTKVLQIDGQDAFRFYRQDDGAATILEGEGDNRMVIQGSSVLFFSTSNRSEFEGPGGASSPYVITGYTLGSSGMKPIRFVADDTEVVACPLEAQSVPGAPAQRWLNKTGTEQVEVSDLGDVKVLQASRGVVLRSPNGNYFRITVDNDGLMSTENLAGVGGAGAGLSWPGVAGNTLSAPDSPAFSSTSVLDIRIDLACSDWITAAYQLLVGHEWEFRISPNTGTLAFYEGSPTWNEGVSTVAPTIANGARLQLRMTKNGTVLRFYTRAAGTDLAVNTGWTQLGADVVTVANVADASVPLHIGSDTSGTQRLLSNSTIYRVRFSDVIDGTADGDFNPSLVTVVGTRNPTSYTDPHGVVWTLTGSDWDWVT